VLVKQLRQITKYGEINLRALTHVSKPHAFVVNDLCSDNNRSSHHAI